MSQLIQMRQRIKAIETIKKITHAMRLIAMSSHSRLKQQQEQLNTYQQEMNALFDTVYSHVPTWRNTRMTPSQKQPLNTLIIVVGSQKGLCGNFNTALFQFFAEHMQRVQYPSLAIIPVGKKATDYVIHHHTARIRASFSTFTMHNVSELAHTLTNTIVQAEPAYTHVALYSNSIKSFFAQVPRYTNLIPLIIPDPAGQETQTKEPYTWQQHPDALLDALAEQKLEANMYQLLFESLLAEQAARFVSMDMSTRNAKNLLEVTTMQYNKLRQAKITKELTELSGSFI